MGCNPKGCRRASITEAAVPYRNVKTGAASVCPKDRPELTVGGAVVPGMVPCIIVYVRPVDRDEKLLARFLHATGCEGEGDPENPGYWMVVGPIPALDELTRHKVVHGWHYVIEGREPMSSGSGEKKGRRMSSVGPKTVAPEYTRKAQGLEQV